MIFDVFKLYDPDNLLYLHTYEEVMTFQFEESRLRAVLECIQKQRIVITKPESFSPFSFPIVVDRVARMVKQMRGALVNR